jgi:hypothetical protein
LLIARNPLAFSCEYTSIAHSLRQLIRQTAYASLPTSFCISDNMAASALATLLGFSSYASLFTWVELNAVLIFDINKTDDKTDCSDPNVNKALDFVYNPANSLVHQVKSSSNTTQA